MKYINCIEKKKPEKSINILSLYPALTKSVKGLKIDLQTEVACKEMFGSEDFMKLALAEAEKGFLRGEVPVGAILVEGNEVIAKAHNRKEMEKDPTAHAEILVIRDASERLGDWRLLGTTLYITAEPCPMCAGAILLSRIPRVVFGCYDKKFGGAGSLYNLLQDERFNHRVEVVSGILEDKCSSLLQEFFKKLRS